uniref:Uncharacterized protein n=1 Tax=Manihot esculenta TaxID=3983 RepID=A0A199U9Z7_MANES
MQARRLGWDIILSIIAVGAEAISAALEQTFPHKVKAARYGVIMAIVSVLLTFADLAFKKPNNKHHKLRWEFADSIGSISSILTLISSCIHYNFLSNGLQQPIQFSTISLAFSHLGFINLDIEFGGILFDNDQPTQFGCPAYQIEQIYPQGV